MPLDRLPVLDSCQVSVLAVAEMVEDVTVFRSLFCPPSFAGIPK